MAFCHPLFRSFTVHDARGHFWTLSLAETPFRQPKPNARITHQTMMNPNRQLLGCNWASPVAFSLETHTGPALSDQDNVPQIRRILRLDCTSDPRLPNAGSDGRFGSEGGRQGNDLASSVSTSGFAMSRLCQAGKRRRLTPDFVRSDSITNASDEVIKVHEKNHRPDGHGVEHLPAWAVAVPVAGGAVERVEKSVSSPRSQKTNTCNRPRQSRKRGLNILAACWETWQRK